MPEPALTPPEDLVRLKADWYAASALSAAIAAEPNCGDEILLQLRAPAHAPGPVEKWLTLQSADQRERHQAARAEVMRLVLALADHPWWKTPEGASPGAKATVNRLARELHQRALAAV